ncbi:MULTISPECIES: hypothetical protein [Niallia]|uniref:hypothetical protein n=1 Tax=Niallia TaxID=2837506 RepID=UPI00201D92A1|nr:hypothetical protein [Niallia circulans]
MDFNEKIWFCKKVSFLTALVLTISSISSISSFADTELTTTNQPISSVENLLISEDETPSNAQVSKEALSSDFNLEEAVADISIQSMDKEERKNFNEAVNEQISFLEVSEEEKEAYKEALINFFDEESETYNNLSAAQEEVTTSFEELSTESNSTTEVSSVSSTITKNLFGAETASAANPFKGKIKIGVNFAGSVLNVAIGAAVGGGVGAITGFIKKKGVKEAQRIFTKTVTSRLKAWGANKLAWAVGASVAVAMDYYDIGSKIAKELDKRDSKPKNGWINIY